MVICVKFKKPPILVGHSLGGMIVQKYIEKYPASAAILLAVPIKQHLIPRKTTFILFLRLIGRYPFIFLKTLVTLNPFHFISTSQLVKELLFSTDTDNEKIEMCARHLDEKSLRLTIDMSLFCKLHKKKLGIPVFVIGGANDVLVQPRDLEAVACIYNAQLYICPDIAHDLMLDCKWINVAVKILKWIKENGL